MTGKHIFNSGYFIVKVKNRGGGERERVTWILLSMLGLKMYIPALILLDTNTWGFSTKRCIRPLSASYTTTPYLDGSSTRVTCTRCRKPFLLHPRFIICAPCTWASFLILNLDDRISSSWPLRIINSSITDDQAPPPSLTWAQNSPNVENEHFTRLLAFTKALKLTTMVPSLPWLQWNSSRSLKGKSQMTSELRTKNGSLSTFSSSRASARGPAAHRHVELSFQSNYINSLVAGA